MPAPTVNEPATGPVLDRSTDQRAWPVHLVNGCGNPHAKARSTDPFAVSCRACHRTHRWVNELVLRLTSLDIGSAK